MLLLLVSVTSLKVTECVRLLSDNGGVRVARTCAGGRGLTHAGRVAAGAGRLLSQLLLGAAVRFVGILLVFDEDFPHQVHWARQRNTGLQLNT